MTLAAVAPCFDREGLPEAVETFESSFEVHASIAGTLGHRISVQIAGLPDAALAAIGRIASTGYHLRARQPAWDAVLDVASRLDPELHAGLAGGPPADGEARSQALTLPLRAQGRLSRGALRPDPPCFHGARGAEASGHARGSYVIRTPAALVLDFDGVICDSIDEGFAASWTAYHRLYLNGTDGQAPDAARAAFARLRPYVRSGEDFVLIQEMVDRGVHVDSQEAFDEWARRAGPSALGRFKELFYAARTSLLESDKDAWLRMNRIYPHVAAGIAALPRGAPLYILSTKRPLFIAEILDARGIVVPRERILHSADEPKLAVVERLRAQGGFEEAVFVEDQIDAIIGNANPRIKAYLATWGYVQKEWLREPAPVALLTPEAFLDLLARTWPRS